MNLTNSEREDIQKLLHSVKHSTRKVTRAWILLKAADCSTDEEIAAALGVGRATVERTRENFVERNLEALNERLRPDQKPKLDTKAKGRLIAEACSKAPEGQAHWRLQLLSDLLVELKIVETLSDEIVRHALKNDLKPWLKEQWCIPTVSSEFVAAIEEMLDLYATPYDPECPKINFYETNKQLIK